MLKEMLIDIRLTESEVQQHRQSLSISDDDLCATCQLLAYCPGNNSLCKAIGDTWPCKFDENQYAKSCRLYTKIENEKQNWALV